MSPWRPLTRLDISISGVLPLTVGYTPYATLRAAKALKNLRFFKQAEEKRKTSVLRILIFSLILLGYAVRQT
ncbi:hypothetical protein XFF6970_820007 [Xanthomonas citri pv. fuscans]|nr:hypothetical protein XFF6970_820007 [Xanthomonas citri pv. fuscans]